MAFVLGCAVTIGGLADDRDWGDVGHYRYIADRVADGEIPYHDYYVEYPPAALAAFLVVQPFDDYAFAFKLAMVVLGLATLAVAMIALRLLEAPSRIPALLVVFAAAPIALGHLLLNRYDLWPALLATGALTAILADRSPLAGGLAGAAFAAKIFTAAAVPVAAVRLARTGGRRSLVSAAASFAFVVVMVVGPFAALAPGGVAYSFWSQSSRALHAESAGGSLLLALDAIGVYDARLRAGLGIEVVAVPADALAVLATLFQVCAIALVTVLYARGAETRDRLVVAFTATVVAFVAFGKVLSPQYLVWLVPLVPLASGIAGSAGSAILLAALFVTQAEVHGFDGLHVEPWAVAALVVRNALLVSLFVLFLRELRR